MRIGISQRVDTVPAYGERRDCLDQQWFRFLESLGFIPVPVPNRLSNIRRWASEVGLEGVILSGGNDLGSLPGASNVAPERDHTEAELLSWAHAHDIPVIGVCRGLQMMNVWLGGRLVPVSGHTAVRHPVVCSATTDALFRAFEEVNSFHNWGIASDGVAESLIPQCLSTEGEVEAFLHHRLAWAGIMWHPEREDPFREADKHLFTGIFRGKPCRH